MNEWYEDDLRKRKKLGIRVASAIEGYTSEEP